MSKHNTKEGNYNTILKQLEALFMKIEEQNSILKKLEEQNSILQKKNQ